MIALAQVKNKRKEEKADQPLAQLHAFNKSLFTKSTPLYFQVTGDR